MNQNLNILILEDNQSDVELMLAEVRQAGISCNEVRVVEGREDFRQALDEFPLHLILSDYNLPQFDALSALEMVEEKYPDVPFIVVTGALDEETAVDTIKSGAWDYVLKENMLRLGPAIHNALALKKKKDELKAAHQQIRKLSYGVEQSPTAIIFTDQKGKLEYVNPRFVEMTGYSMDEVIGIHLQEVQNMKQWDGESYRELWNHLKQGKEWRAEYENKKKDGTAYWERLIISPIRNDEGDISNYLLIKEDISEQKRREGELKRAKEQAEESDRLKSEFLANMSHEIRTPMNGILGFAKLLKNEGPGSSEWAEYVDIILKSSNQLLRIISDIVDYSKIEAGQYELHDEQVQAVQLLEEIRKLFFEELEPEERDKLKLRIQTHHGEKERFILADERKLKQVVSNLVENAVKFTHEGFVELGYRLHDESILFYVKDTGIGISEEKIDVIFQKFRQADSTTTREYGGTGLGLTISRRLVEIMDGQLWVDSKVNHGSTFYFTIPYRPVATRKKAEQPGNEELDWSAHRILVVEDDHPSYLYFSHLLSKTGVHLTHAKSGEEAWQLFTEKDFDLILMDIRLGDMNGLDLARRIRQYNQNIPILAQTAYALSSDKAKSLDAGCNDYVSKPIQPGTFLTKIDDLLNLGEINPA
jgi:PAS domain S-box-containing protein